MILLYPKCLKDLLFRNKNLILI